MSEQAKCPKCGAEFVTYYNYGISATFKCRTRIDVETGAIEHESDDCLRNQLATQAAEIERLKAEQRQHDLLHRPVDDIGRLRAEAMHEPIDFEAVAKLANELLNRSQG